MPNLSRTLCTLVVLPLLLGACAPAAPAPVRAPAEAGDPAPAGTQAPAATATAAPPLEPVTLAGPPMEVGSKITYVDGSVLVAVPAGQFLMGHEGPDNPEHTVSLSDFWIYRTPVTNAMYARCVAAGWCAPPEADDNPAFQDPYRANDPVVGVDYARAGSYCAFVLGRLPTEAEWEKTARGPEGNLYPWGDGAPSCELANLADCERETTDVTTYPGGQSHYEALDTAGNVFEWVADWYQPAYYGESPLEDPPGPQTGEKRSVRSSAFDSPFYFAELARRSASLPSETRPDLGFRCVVEDPAAFAPYCEQVQVYGLPPGSGDPAGGGLASENCPNLSITQGKDCGPNYTPFTVVTFNASPSSALMTINVPGMPDCQDVGGNQYVCYASVAVSAQADCQVTLPGEPACPPGYTTMGDACVPDGGSGGRCLPGYNYDPSNQCCSAAPGSPGTNLPLPVCPVGTYYANPPGACVPVPAAGTVSVNQVVGLKACEPGGGDDDCEPQSCGVAGANLVWCQSLCACISSTAPCP